MTTTKESIHSSKEILRYQHDERFEIVFASREHLENDELEELASHSTQSRYDWPLSHGPTHALETLPSSRQAIKHFETRLGEFEKKLQAAVDIGLENRTSLERLLQDDESRIGLGAIHSVDQGRVQLHPPLFYRYQVIDDDDVVVSIEDLGVYGVGSTEGEAVREVEEELWSIFQDLEQTPPEEIGVSLARILRTMKERIQ